MTPSTGRIRPAASTSPQKTEFRPHSTTKSFGKVSRERLRPLSEVTTTTTKTATAIRAHSLANRWDPQVPPRSSAWPTAPLPEVYDCLGCEHEPCTAGYESTCKSGIAMTRDAKGDRRKRYLPVGFLL